jgi:hypothetical protein
MYRFLGHRILLSALAAALAAPAMAAAPASASTQAPIHGPFLVAALPSRVVIQQLFAGSDGRLWFVTAGSKLGLIDAAGQITLTGITLPHGQTPAVIAGAGAGGVWAYNQDDTGSCRIARTAGGSVTPIPLPAVVAQSRCGGAAADTAGDLWVALDNPCGSFTCGRRVAFVADITPGGRVSLHPPVDPGALPGAVALGSDGAIWVLEGRDEQFYGRYTPSGTPTAYPSNGNWFTLLARPGGTFWVGVVRYCSGSTSAFCLLMAVSTPGSSFPAKFIFPVSFYNSNQLAVDAAGAVWQAGHERIEPDRLFRMESGGIIDRSAAFPPAPGGATLHATGPLAITAAGYVWTVAASSNGAESLLRYLPSD